jgi:A/G-specific adenine glycosylase
VERGEKKICLLCTLKSQVSTLRPPLSTLQRRLLRWFDRHQRNLPWRKNRDPYRIWVSEVMLQQTQVATVLRYFEPFIRAFPSIKALAAASEQAVLRQWEGMGYYRRARHLHQAARQLCRDHGGRLRDDPEIFSDLPGVGRYILGAVLSQAFDRRLPVVEANSRRVLQRLFAGNGRLATTRNGARSLGDAWLWEAAEAILPARRVGDFNQAMMELGALICTPIEPRCNSCPLSRSCETKKLGLQATIPGRRPAPEEVRIHEAAVVIRRGPRVLLVQRPPGSRWENMWEFPHDHLRSNETPERAAKRIARRVVGLRVRLSRELTTLKHAVTNHRITLSCFEAQYLGGRFRSNFYRQKRWLTPDQLHDFPVSAPQRRLALALLER